MERSPECKLSPYFIALTMRSCGELNRPLFVYAESLEASRHLSYTR